jgi:hypothetical protein
MEQERDDDSLGTFVAWVDELNDEAVRRRYTDWPLQTEIAHSRNCWMIDFERGLTPAQALDADKAVSPLV